MDNQNIISIYELLRTIFIIMDVILLAFFIFLIVKSWRFRPKFWSPPKDKDDEATYNLGNVVLRERWEAIISKSKINSQESIKSAIIDADNFIDDLLERMGLQGQSMATKNKISASMADKLENLSTNDFITVNKLRSAHDVRNKIVHEPNFSISQEEAWKVLDDYGSFLEEIRVI